MGVGKVGLSTISVQVSPIHVDNDLLSKDHSAYLLHNHLVLKFGILKTSCMPVSYCESTMVLQDYTVVVVLANNVLCVGCAWSSTSGI